MHEINATPNQNCLESPKMLRTCTALGEDVMNREIQAVMNQLCGLLSSSISSFSSPSANYQLQPFDADSTSCGIKGNVVLQEDTLCSMDLAVKPSKTSALIKSTFREDKQWKLQQIQDAINHLKMAFNMISMFENPVREHSGSLYEIATAHRCYCLIPWLSKVVMATDICLQLGNQLKEKISQQHLAACNMWETHEQETSETMKS